MLKAVQRLLRQHAYEPIVFSTAQAFKNYYSDLENAVCVILDINLPDRTGWDVLRDARLPDDVRVLMLTAVPVSPRRLAEFRPVAYLPKPFPLEALLRLAESSSRTVSEDDRSEA